jgi:hypothetical protein
MVGRRTEIGSIARRSWPVARARLRTHLRRAGGNILATARLMNCSSDTVTRWIVRLNLVDDLRLLRRLAPRYGFRGLRAHANDTFACRPAGRSSTRS